MPLDARLARSLQQRREVEAEADRILAADARTNKPKPVRVRFRGSRPAWNWLARRDTEAAAAVWVVARRLLPEAANDNLPPDANFAIERRKDGKPRGPSHWQNDVEAYLALPPVQPRLGEGNPVRLDHWWRERDSGNQEPPRIEIKQQRQIFALQPYCRFGYCAPAVATGATFLGAEGGLGLPKLGKQRGDIRPVDEVELPAIPERIWLVLENVLARATLEGVGVALGYKGGYADRKGREAVLELGRWAQAALAA
jgi:hypothetical protein